MKRTPLARKTPMRRSRPKTSKARQSARGMSCMVRLPGCDGGGETTVLAHYRLASGAAMKPDDSQGAWACHRCHDVVDGRAPAPPGYTRQDVRLAHAEGVLRTQEAIRRAAA